MHECAELVDVRLPAACGGRPVPGLHYSDRPDGRPSGISRLEHRVHHARGRGDRRRQYARSAHAPRDVSAEERKNSSLACRWELRAPLVCTIACRAMLQLVYTPAPGAGSSRQRDDLAGSPAARARCAWVSAIGRRAISGIRTTPPEGSTGRTSRRNSVPRPGNGFATRSRSLSEPSHVRA